MRTKPGSASASAPSPSSFSCAINSPTYGDCARGEPVALRLRLRLRLRLGLRLGHHGLRLRLRHDGCRHRLAAQVRVARLLQRHPLAPGRVFARQRARAHARAVSIKAGLTARSPGCGRTVVAHELEHLLARQRLVEDGQVRDEAAEVALLLVVSPAADVDVALRVEGVGTIVAMAGVAPVQIDGEASRADRRALPGRVRRMHLGPRAQRVHVPRAVHDVDVPRHLARAIVVNFTVAVQIILRVQCVVGVLDNRADDAVRWVRRLG
mmetsp:Transcript_7469/g.22722  ORF Transcript_7469/g.22722 Transcript_7469/m.22722 type:complete len:266 (+) Transcript_7469:282-1079(+)